jgi:hypothetical protein
VTTRVLVAAVGIVGLAALALGRVPARQLRTPAGGPAATPRAEATAPVPRAVDPDTIRDLFRFSDGSARPEERAGRERARSGQSPSPAPAPTPPPGPRLVGLVSRGGRMVAALAADGEVVLAGPGETAAGVTVVAVDGDGVRIRRPDGTEEVLALP